MTQLKVGDKVVRKTSEVGYTGKLGTVVCVDTLRDRALVRWENDRTWHKTDWLIYIGSST